jgi:Mor family transcriptional regulator
MLAATTSYDALYENYLPFRLYSEHSAGTPVRELAQRYGFSEGWVAERVEAARLCHRQIKITQILPSDHTFLA